MLWFQSLDLGRVILTYDDLCTAGRFIEVYLARRLYGAEGLTPDGFIADAVTLAIAVTYARPFGMNDPRKRNNDNDDLERARERWRQAWWSFLKKGLPDPELHKRIVEDRKKVFAHSDADARKITWNDLISTMRSPPPLKKGEAQRLLNNVERMRAKLEPSVRELGPFLRVRPSRNVSSSSRVLYLRGAHVRPPRG